MSLLATGAWGQVMTLIGEVTFFVSNRSGHPFTTPCSYPSYHNPPFLKIRPYNR